tara:strand:+ start:92 stop:355 length:264 start_codon:yes stop_codon:yes gene_type:complete
MLDNVSIQQIKLIRHEYDQLKTQKQKDAYIDDLTDQVYERRHELYELWALDKKEKASGEMPSHHTSPTNLPKIIGIKHEHTNKHKQQ